MSEAVGVDWIEVITTTIKTDWFKILIGSGGIATFLTLLYNRRAARRQEIVDMAKFRIEKISDKTKSYMELNRYSVLLCNQLSDLRVDPQLLDDYMFSCSVFYYLIRFFKILHRIFLTEGGIVLSNQDAEAICTNLAVLSLGTFGDTFSPVARAHMTKIIPDGATIDQLDFIMQHDPIARNLHNRFVMWLRDPTNNNIIDTLYKRLFCLAEILIYELNVVYEIWYRKTFYSSEQISADCKHYLMNDRLFVDEQGNTVSIRDKHPNYYYRLFRQRRTRWSRLGGYPN